MSYKNFLLYGDPQMDYTTSQLRHRSEVEDRTIRTKYSTPEKLRCKAVEKTWKISCRLYLSKRNKNNSFDLSRKDSSKGEIVAADRTREGKLLWRYWWTGPDLSSGTFRSTRAWGSWRLKV